MATTTAPENIMSVLREDRVFKPAAAFAQRAHIKSLAQYQRLYRESVRDPEKFWARQAKTELVWFKPWKKVLQWKLPNAKWFIGGQLNVSYNCLDRHLGTATANKAALIWEGEPAGPGRPGEERTSPTGNFIARFASSPTSSNATESRRATVSLSTCRWCPEAAIAMLACARIGAVHSVVFGGFSAQSVADRIFDCQARLVITADGGFRRGSDRAAQEKRG